MRSIAQQWIDEGIEKGIEKGIPRGVRVTLRKQLRLRFPTVSEAALAQLDEADLPTLERWSERVLTASSVDDVFA